MKPSPESSAARRATEDRKLLYGLCNVASTECVAAKQSARLKIPAARPTTAATVTTTLLRLHTHDGTLMLSSCQCNQCTV
mmetsp:Transcript_27088/g.62668  ORF Transcript_27088/g.62668 Transcript_27088/m.62668 type:complete len:80 (+) Transcript_27088:579-818(+)